jgi:hypothetical protein
MTKEEKLIRVLLGAVIFFSQNGARFYDIVFVLSHLEMRRNQTIRALCYFRFANRDR